MMQQRQFSLMHLFAELTLIAAALGAMRVVYVLHDSHNNWTQVFVVFPAVCAVPILAGAVIGGFLGRFWSGAAWGAGALVVLLLLNQLLLQVK